MAASKAIGGAITRHEGTTGALTQLSLMAIALETIRLRAGRRANP